MDDGARVGDGIDAEPALRRRDFEKIVEAMVPLVAELGYGAATAELLATQIKPELEAIYERYRPALRGLNPSAPVEGTGIAA